MEFSYKIKRLLLAAVAVLVLALAANEGTKNIPTPSKPIRQPVPYPFVPLDIDPNAINVPEPSPFIQAPKDVKPVPITVRPAISAEAYIVANLDTGMLYTEHNSNHVYPIASLSKLITAIVALHHMPPGQKIVITQPMLDAYGDAGHLVLGETYTLSEILYPLLLESSNDAAEAIAQTYGYANFIGEMNAFVAGLGMTSTSFKDASGLNPGNVSDAGDLLLLARYIYMSEKPLLELTRQTAFSVASTTDHGAHTWNTINPFPFDPHFMGGKTGRTTEAKESMMSFFRYTTTDGKTYPVIIVVLRSDFSVREIDSSLLFSQFIRKIGGN
jgi:D-alanyl-D-alanine carboxypeptidase